MLHGQEIYLFFYRFGKNGLVGIVLCNLIISYIIYKTLKIVLEKDVKTYKEFLNIIIPTKKLTKYKYLNLNYIMYLIINIFLISTFFIMIAGFGAYFSQEYGINRIIASSILSIICYFLFLGNIEKIAKINNIIIPVLILFIIIIGVKNILRIDINKIGENTDVNLGLSWLLNSVLYSSYNLILTIPVLINLKKYIKNKKQVLLISVLTGIIISIISIFNFLLLVNVDINFLKLEMPIVYVINKNYPKYSMLYGIIILIAIFTTANTCGISFLNNLKSNYKRSALVLSITSVIISIIGFSNLVKNLFTVFGYIGIIEMFFIVNRDGHF